MPIRRHRAFTLVELLVVIAIIGVLVSLLLPAVNSAREAARRTQCKNNLAQLSLALLNFESSQGGLPAAGLTEPNGSTSMFDPNFDPLSGPQISWMVLILPFVEEQALYDRFELSSGLTVFDQNSDPQAATIASYLCPSDSAGGQIFRHPLFTNDAPLGKGNYAAYVSPQHVGDLQFLPGALGGFKPSDTVIRGQRLMSVKDGLSRTIAITEVRTRADEGDLRGAWAVPWGGASVLTLHIDHDFDQFDETPYQQQGIDFYVPDEQFASWAHGPNSQYNPVDFLYRCRSIPSRAERMPCQQLSPSNRWWATGSPRSLHPGGVVVAALDGHVGFMSDEIDTFFVLSRLISTDDATAIDATEHIR